MGVCGVVRGIPFMGVLTGLGESLRSWKGESGVFGVFKVSVGFFGGSWGGGP